VKDDGKLYSERNWKVKNKKKEIKGLRRKKTKEADDRSPKPYSLLKG